MLDWFLLLFAAAGVSLDCVGFLCNELVSVIWGPWALDVALISGSVPGSASIFNLAFVERSKD